MSFFTTFCFAQVPTIGLIGSWPFSGNANDASINGNNGIVSGATLTVDRFGSVNSAYYFDGVNDQILIPASPELYRYNTSFTISAWVRQSATPPGYSQPIFTNRTNTAGSEFYIDGAGNGTGMEGYLGFATYNSGVYGICRSSGPIAINSGYQHVVVVFKHNGNNNNVATVYVNGILNNSESGLVDIPFSNEDTYIGWGPNFTQINRHFEGDIDDIFIYDRDITPTEVLSLYNATTASVPEKNINEIDIYPNPTSDLLNISSGDSSIKQYTIYNIAGEIVQNELFSQDINVGRLDQGTYFIQLLSQENGILGYFKFVKI